ncbi:MAG: RDD family protein [bacterium]|uniref:RDD family protein n=1 Tax=Candidatus Methylomirabilis tolerans TaxID=3123416 RepID=A0AAJ1AIZ6_9BACT|nr:RDD family protein [Candidatus Methylomirabilis sp.]
MRPAPQADAPESGAGPQAGFWIRLAAWAIDIPCLFLVTIAFALAALTTIYLGGRLGGEINSQVMVLAGYSIVAIVMLSGMVYCTIFVGSYGQTPGKMVYRLKVIRIDGQEMTYGRALLRSLCWILSLLLFGIGFLMIACTRQKRGLHDILAGTSVIRLQRLS